MLPSGSTRRPSSSDTSFPSRILLKGWRSFYEEPLHLLNEFLEVPAALEDCAIVGAADTVLARLVELVDELGPFGTLVMVGHDWDESGLSQGSMHRMAEDILPQLKQHVDSLGSERWIES